MLRRSILALAIIDIVGTALLAQQPPAISGAQFDVDSIKLNKTGERGPFQTLPDGTFRSSGTPISLIVQLAAPVPVFEIVGLPDWAKTDGYDLIGKPPPGMVPSREQQKEMMRNLLIERMKFVAHVEEQERDGFA